MSIFETQSLACPSCAVEVSFQVAHSVLADRRPDLRAAILAGTFQSATCDACGVSFRREPELNYLDVGRRQWLLVKPAAAVADWPALEAQAQGIFELAYGSLAPAAAQAIGSDLSVRIAFGWPAFCEKLLVVQAGLDDVALECLKLNLLRSLDAPALTDTVEMRLQALDDRTLTMHWLDADGEQPLETMQVPRSLYDAIVAAPSRYQTLRASLTAGPFVDMNRLLIDPADREVLPQDAEA